MGWSDCGDVLVGLCLYCLQATELGLLWWCLNKLTNQTGYKPGPIDQSIVSPNVDPGVASSILCGDWSWNNFYGHSPPADYIRVAVSYKQKYVYKILVNFALEKVWLAGWHDHSCWLGWKYLKRNKMGYKKVYLRVFSISVNSLFQHTCTASKQAKFFSETSSACMCLWFCLIWFFTSH